MTAGGRAVGFEVLDVRIGRRFICTSPQKVVRWRIVDSIFLGSNFAILVLCDIFYNI